MNDTTASARARTLLEELNRCLAARDFAGASHLFAEECYWRDLVLLTWNIKTMEGRAQIEDMLAAQLDAAAPVRFGLDEREAVEEADGVLSAWITIDTRHARGDGHVRIRDGRIWTLLTAAQELKGHEEPRGTRRPMGAEHGIRRGRQTWLERRQQEAEELGHAEQPYVLVIGGDHGFGGAALLSAESALRAGAGLVSLATRPEHLPASLARLPEVMCQPTESTYQLLGLCERADVLVVGPGLGQQAWGRSLLSAALASGRPQVWDADALNLLAAGALELPADSVITPHPGEAARLLALVNDIIRLSELDEGAEDTDKAEITDILEVANDAVKSISGVAKKAGITVTAEGVSTLVNGGKSLIFEMIYNLCDNAVKYNRENGSVKVCVGSAGGSAFIRVSDTGIGIAPEHIDRIFERFYRVDKSRSKQSGGTGLGLSIVKHIALSLGGKISTESKPGYGTEITVSLPIAEK